MNGDYRSARRPRRRRFTLAGAGALVLAIAAALAFGYLDDLRYDFKTGSCITFAHQQSEHGIRASSCDAPGLVFQVTSTEGDTTDPPCPTPDYAVAYRTNGSTDNLDPSEYDRIKGYSACLMPMLTDGACYSVSNPRLQYGAGVALAPDCNRPGPALSTTRVSTPPGSTR